MLEALCVAQAQIGKHGGRHATTYLRAYQCEKCHGGFHLTKERRDTGQQDFIELKTPER